MFNTTIVENKVNGIVGCKQPYDPNYDIVDSDNQASRSGYFVTDLPLAKIKYFKDCQDYESITDANFNTILSNLQRSAISNVCNEVFTTEDFQDRNVFYKNANNNIDAAVLTDGFVGFRLELANEKNIAFEIPRVILDFKDTFGAFTLYLFNTGDPNPIHSKTITITEQHQVEELNWTVDNSGDTYKGDYYIGYNKTVTTPVPFKRNYGNANVLSSITGIDITPMQIVGHSTGVLFDLTSETGLSENIGVNPDIIVYDDYTDFIVQNQRLFARAIQLEMGINMINECISSSRVNRNKRVSESVIVRMLQTIDGVDTDSIKITGLASKLSGAIKTIKQEIDKLKKGFLGGRIMVETLI
jgi:hypothetical protein